MSLGSVMLFAFVFAMATAAAGPPKVGQAGAEVIGISVDTAKRNRDFANELHITFPVLSDETKQVTREYGVLYPLIRVAKRVTFVIDRQGVIREITEGGEAADPSKREQSCSLLSH